MAAIHLVRSLSFVKMHGQVTDTYFDNCVADFLADPQLLELFVSDHGRQPAPGAGIPGLLVRYGVQLVQPPELDARIRARGSARAACAP